MSGPVGVGLIGAGVISNQYLENLTRAPDVRVVMIADLDPARAAAQAATYGVASLRRARDLLERDDIEIVVNLTIPAAHVPVALDALAAGKHVWSEKPFALDRESGARLLAEARAGRPARRLRAGHRARCRDPDRRRLLEAGAIGEPLTALTLVRGPRARRAGTRTPTSCTRAAAARCSTWARTTCRPSSSCWDP